MKSEVWNEFEKIAAEQGLVKIAAKKKEEKKEEEPEKDGEEKEKIKEEKKRKKIEKKKIKKAFAIELLKVADALDVEGLEKEAQQLDNVVQEILAEDEE